MRELNNIKKFFRYEAVQYASKDMNGEYITSEIPNPSVELRTFYLHKETPKGFWIGYGVPQAGLQSYRKWVSKTSRKRYAYPTEKEALTNFITRNIRRIKILQYQIDSCRTAVCIAKEMKTELMEKV